MNLARPEFNRLCRFSGGGADSATSDYLDSRFHKLHRKNNREKREEEAANCLGTKMPLVIDGVQLPRNAESFWLLIQTALCAIAFARERAGSNIPARIARIAMTTSNSINVKARFF